MPKSNLHVDVNEEPGEDIRTITITITAPADMFLFADQLALRKMIPTCSVYFKTAVTEATKGYLESAEEVVSGVKSDQRKEAPAAKEGQGKRGPKRKHEDPENGIPPSGMKVKSVDVSAVSSAAIGD
jgi:hypothetical protein